MLKTFKTFSIWKKIGTILGGLVVLVVIILIVGIVIAPDYTRMKTPANYPINSTHYLTMQDGTKVFIDVWLPDNLQPEEKIPAIMETSRYITHMQLGPLYKLMQTFFKAPDLNYDEASRFTRRGYAYVFVQAPGSGASTGTRRGEYLPEEIEAMGLAIDWIVAQPWSNQRVGATGESYSGTTADLSVVAKRPELKAVAPLFSDFDPYTQLVRPGGLFDEPFTRAWSDMTRAMDHDDFCAVIEAADGEKLSSFNRFLLSLMIRGTKRPQGKDRALYGQALQDHQTNQEVYPAVQALEFKDDEYGDSGQTVEDIAIYNYKNEFEKAQVNAHYRLGWLDAGTTEGALQRYLLMDTPQKIEIGPWGHGSEELVNPFSPTVSDETDAYEESLFVFFDKHLKAEGDQEEKEITYYTFGGNTWKTTTVWPPKHVNNEIWYFAPEFSLVPEPPTESTGNDRYTVDFTVTTGKSNRWIGQMGETVEYPDRREEDQKLLTYTSQPLGQDIEVTGSPTVTLYVSSTHADGAFHVYLEDVAPDGRVSYLTEGVLRAIHRKIADPADAPFIPLGVYHSFKRKDAMPLVPGGIAEIRLTLFPISTVFKAGHQIRVAIAGYDEALGTRYPAEGTPILTIERNSVYSSQIELPMSRR